MSLSNYLENKLGDTLRNTSFTVAQAYASLHSADPGETGASEISGGAGPYIRKAVTLSAFSSGASSNSAQLEWTGMPAVTLTHVGLWDAESAGNFLWGGALAASKIINAGDTFQIPIGDLDLSLD